MLMCKQVILTVLIIAIALGAKPEFQMLSVLLRPAADCTFVTGGLALRLHFFYTLLKLPAALHLLR